MKELIEKEIKELEDSKENIIHRIGWEIELSEFEWYFQKGNLHAIKKEIIFLNSLLSKIK